MLLVSLLLVGGCQLAEPEPTADRFGTPTEESPVVAADPTSSPPQDTAPSPDTAPVPETSPVPETAPVPETSPDVSPSAGPTTAPHDLADCSPAQVSAIDEVIGNQLQAFNAGDFAEALDWTTPGFRRGFTPESFEALITQDFPVPATATDHEVLSCTVVDQLAVTTVQVSGPAGEQALEYGLQLVAGAGWRIGGALPLADPDTDDTII